MSCLLFKACPGSLGEVPEYPSQMANGTLVTNQCAKSEGFTGDICSECLPGFYQLKDGGCLQCPSGVSGDNNIERYALFASIMGILYGTIVISAAFCKTQTLQTVGLLVGGLQRTLLVLGSISKALPDKWAQALLWLSPIQLDYTLVSLPGCSMSSPSRISFVAETVVFLGLVVATAFLVVLAASLRACWLKRKSKSKIFLSDRVNWRRSFGRRACFSLLMIGVSFYMPVCKELFRAVECVEVEPGGRRVVLTNPATECYKGSHLVLAVFVWPLLILYALFPLFVAVTLFRSNSKSSEPVVEGATSKNVRPAIVNSQQQIEDVADLDNSLLLDMSDVDDRDLQSEEFGKKPVLQVFFGRGVKPEHHKWYPSFLFIANAAVVPVSSFSKSSVLAVVFVVAVLFSAKVVLTFAFLPNVGLASNIFHLVTGLAQVAQCAVFIVWAEGKSVDVLSKNMPELAAGAGGAVVLICCLVLAQKVGLFRAVRDRFNCCCGEHSGTVHSELRNALLDNSGSVLQCDLTATSGDRNAKRTTEKRKEKKHKKTKRDRARPRPVNLVSYRGSIQA